MSSLFPPNRDLLLPRFETYRLHSLDQDNDVLAYPLPGNGATQSRVGYNTHNLGWREVRARIGFNHLATGKGGRAVYVDGDWNIVGVEIGNDLIPRIEIMATLPTPVGSSLAVEYPSVAAISSTQWAISTGSGSIYILETTPPSSSGNFAGELIARYDLTLPPDTYPIPCTIQAVHLSSPTEAQLLLSRSVQASGATSSSSKASTKSFELLQVSIDPTARTSVDGAGTSQGESDGEASGKGIKVDWILQGGDLPYHCNWHSKGWMVLSSEPFTVADSAESAPGLREPMRAAPGEDSGNNVIRKRGLGAPKPVWTPPPISTPPSVEEKTSDYPYSWRQTGETVNLKILLPPDTDRKDFEVKLTSTTLQLQVTPSSLESASSETRTFLARATPRTFWSDVDLEESSYTYDQKTGILDIDITKQGDPNRWPSLFLPDNTDDEDEDEQEEVEVPETIDEAQMASMRSLFAAQAAKTRGAEGEPEGNHPTIPALLREEMDFDLEDEDDMGYGEEDLGVPGDLGGGGKSGSSVGREVFIGYIPSSLSDEDDDGGQLPVKPKPSWSKQSTTVLSFPLSSPEDDDDEASMGARMIVKSAVDGLLFDPPPPLESSGNPTKIPWRHISTSPALAFVLSSKRDLRTVRHIITSSISSTSSTSIEHSPKRAKLESALPSSPEVGPTILAFDAGSSKTGQGNLYVYYPAVSKTEAKQGVVSVSGGERGALLGVGCVRVGERDVVLALCERELVVLKGVLL